MKLSRTLTATQWLRFVVVGPLGTTLGALQYELLWRLNPLGVHRAWTTWLVSNALGIAWVHALHCRFTFREQRCSYRDSIGTAARIYAGSTLAGAFLMQVFTYHLGWHRTPSWLGVTAITSLLNFCLLRGLTLAHGRAGLETGGSP